LILELKRETWCRRLRRLKWALMRLRVRTFMTLGQRLLASLVALAMMFAGSAILWVIAAR